LDGGKFDLVSDFAMPLSRRMICDLVGFPQQDGLEIEQRAWDLSKAFGVRIPVEDRSAADAAVEWFREYIRALLAERRSSPRNDFLSQISLGQNSCGLDPEEIIDNIAFLLFA